MAKTKETKMFPEQQEKMTQEVMASLQSSTYGKDLLAELKNRLKISIFLWRKSCASR